MTTCSAMPEPPLPAPKPQLLRATLNTVQLKTQMPRQQKLGSSPAPWSQFNPKRKTTVPPGTSRLETGAAYAYAREALVNNTDGGEIDETYAYSRSTNSSWTEQANPSRVGQQKLEQKQL